MQFPTILFLFSSLLPLTLAAPCEPEPTNKIPNGKTIYHTEYPSTGTHISSDQPSRAQPFRFGGSGSISLQRQPSSGAADGGALNPIIVFTFPTASSSWSDKRCQIHLDNPVLSVGGDGKQAYVFELPEDQIDGVETMTWNTRREAAWGRYRGIFRVEEGGKTEWIANPADDGQLVECPTRAGQKVALELIIVSDTDTAYEWMGIQKGVRIEVIDK